MQVCSIAEESNLRCAAMLRGIAAESSRLPKLWCEDLVFDVKNKIESASTVPSTMLREPTAARDMVQKMLQDAGCNTADSVAKLLLQKSASLVRAQHGGRLGGGWRRE